MLTAMLKIHPKYAPGYRARHLQTLGLNGLGSEKKRVFVYDSPIFEKYTRLRLSTASGQEGMEVLIHRWLENSNGFFTPLNSNCRVANPENADFYYVPFYHNGYQREFFDPPLLDSTEVMREAFRRRDHVFLFAHEYWGARELVTDHNVDKSILLVVESNPLDMASSAASSRSTTGTTTGGSTTAVVPQTHVASPHLHCLDCFDGRKDVVLPQHIDFFAIRKFLQHNRNYFERKKLFCFRGAMEHALYELGTTDPAEEAQPATEVSVGGHLTPVIEYYKLMGDCRFCLIPKGVGWTNGRVFEGFFSGCIPVVLSDALRFPFEKEEATDEEDKNRSQKKKSTFPFRWQASLVVKFPTRWMAALPEFLAAVDANWTAKASLFRELTSTSGEEMQRNLAEKRCWIDYYSKDPDCSPYEGMIRKLQRNRIRVAT
eukprot:g14606.t1